MHARKPTHVLIVKGNGSGNYGVPKVDEKRLKTDMVPYASAVGSFMNAKSVTLLSKSLRPLL